MSRIEQKVMAGVGAIYAFRQLTGATALKLYVCLAALAALGRLVWVERVFSNWAHAGLGGTLEFVTSAVLNAEAAVQLLFATLILAGLLLTRDLIRGVDNSWQGRMA